MGYVEERINFQTNFFNGISFFEKKSKYHIYRNLS